MRRWCRYAGIPRCTFHVLRKTRNGHVAESGARDAQGRAVTGHTKDSTFACFARLAGREALADIAMSNPKKGMDLQMAGEKTGAPGRTRTEASNRRFSVTLLFESHRRNLIAAFGRFETFRF